MGIAKSEWLDVSYFKTSWLLGIFFGFIFFGAVLWLESTLPSDPHSGRECVMLHHKIPPFLAGVPDSFNAEKSRLVMAKVRVRDLQRHMTVILNSAPAVRLAPTESFRSTGRCLPLTPGYMFDCEDLMKMIVSRTLDPKSQSIDACIWEKPNPSSTAVWVDGAGCGRGASQCLGPSVQTMRETPPKQGHTAKQATQPRHTKRDRDTTKPWPRHDQIVTENNHQSMTKTPPNQRQRHKTWPRHRRWTVTETSTKLWQSQNWTMAKDWQSGQPITDQCLRAWTTFAHRRTASWFSLGMFSLMCLIRGYIEEFFVPRDLDVARCFVSQEGWWGRVGRRLDGVVFGPFTRIPLGALAQQLHKKTAVAKESFWRLEAFKTRTSQTTLLWTPDMISECVSPPWWPACGDDKRPPSSQKACTTLP